ncbi:MULTISPECIES: hypothetical protein [unclassified Coleofasciculus]|uniref:hypothetical protein n=1 Tax=unclassified Coleofasciculus TaxID=2692782 RepID=UPI00187FEBB2|nr:MULTISPECIES: hypothetical protein [unclassified Coleofasciculus]MBE9126556.1 hypothetical protein [Coleofasciculus sp. LEGE 07081]MBE9149990.1 hypothetical protein [Coleofasciculus sp. LEGE 07092]
MTPTLLGRWQTRLFLFATVGLLITLPFYWGIISPNTGFPSYPVFFRILAYVVLFGLGWDILYNYLQKFRWDRDWPGVLQLLAGIWEGGFLLSIVKLFGLPSIPKEVSPLWFIIHYSLVWLGVYVASQSLMRIVFPRWRFRGGRLI